jgi:DNA-binding transcriptional LysR family regulator
VQNIVIEDDPYCLALPADHRLASRRRVVVAELAHEDFVSFGRDRGVNYFDRTVAMCVEAGFSPAIRHEANNFWSALGVVAAGLGVSIVPASCALLRQPGVTMRRLPTSRHQSRLALLAPKERRHPLLADITKLATQQFVLLRQSVKQLLH